MDNKFNLDDDLVDKSTNQDNFQVKDDDILREFLGNPETSFENDYVMENVATFDVLEAIQSTAEKSRLDISTENFTIGIPENWNINSHTMNIDAIAQEWNITRDGSIEASSMEREWDFSASQYVSDDSWGFRGDYSNELGIISTADNGVINPYIPRDALAVWSQEDITKPDPEAEIHETELISTGNSEFALYNQFNEEPSWGDELIGISGSNWERDFDNPYGGDKKASNRRLEYNDVDESLQAYIHAGSSLLTLGNPSIGWNVVFPELTAPDFIPKKYEFITYWKVEALSFEASDNLSIIARIDGQYIDGRTDTNGVSYPNATATTLENSLANIGEPLGHDYVVRIFDITELIDSQKSNHTLDFGIWFENINDTSDEVQVSFGGVFIRAIEEDQYDIGNLEFECEINFDNTFQMRNWYLFSVFANNSGSEIFVPLGFIDDIFTAPQESKNLQYNLSTRHKSILNSDQFIFHLGILNLGGERPHTWDFSVSFDDIFLEVIYNQPNLTKVGLQRWNGTSWINQTEFGIDSKVPLENNNLTMAFNITNPLYASSFLEFEDNLIISRNQSNNASATYIIPSFSEIAPERILWNVSYDNANTFDQLINHEYENFNPRGYNFTVVDLPAYDGLGENSTDWLWTGGVDPTGVTPEYAKGFSTNGSQNNPNSQNLTIAEATEKLNDFNYINGTWILTYSSKNCLADVFLIHDDAPENTRFYDQNSTILQVNQSNIEEVEGNYNITIFDASNEIIPQFPAYFPHISGNLTDSSWIINDTGVGEYSIYAIWNNTEGGQTTQLGIARGTFEVWRSLNANITQKMNELNSGDVGNFYLNISHEKGLPISGAENYLNIFWSDSENLWGIDWPPNQYLIGEVYENSSFGSEGNYTLEFKTRSVPIGNYDIFIEVTYPFYDEVKLYSIIKISGYPMSMNIISGAFNTDIYTGLIHSNNLPRVDDNQKSTIEVNVTNSSNGAPLSNGQLTGKFNGTDNIFYGVDIYQQTQKESDRGLYYINLNAYGLNTTSRMDTFNYTLSLTISLDGYNSTYIEFSTAILPIATQLVSNTLEPLYEESKVDIYATFDNINQIESPLPLSGGDLSWKIQNESFEMLAYGNLTNLLSGVYASSIDFTEDGFHLEPGIYILEITANLINCENASWIQSNFQILEKKESQINILLTESLQIGKIMDLVVNLSYILNSSPIFDAEIQIILNFDGFESLQIFKTTDGFGMISYSQMISSEYAETTLDVHVIYLGTPYIQNSSYADLNNFIKGKNSVNLSIELDADSMLRVGYQVILSGNLSISSYEDYIDIYLTVAAWVDGDNQNLVFIQQIYVNEDGVYEYLTPAIPDGYQNITFFIDYAGTAINGYASASIVDQVILMKWETSFEITNLKSMYRIGEEFDLNILAKYLDSSCNFSFYTESIFIIYEYEGMDPIIRQAWFGFSGIIVIDYEIPQDCGDWLNITLNFQGNSTIQSFMIVYTIDIWDKWDVNFEIVNIQEDLRHGAITDYNIQALFTNSSSVETLNGLETTIIIYFAGSSIYLTDTIIINSSIYISYEIPFDDGGDWMNISISFSGTSKISSFQKVISYSILPRLKTTLILLDTKVKEDFSGDFTFSVKLIDENGKELQGQTIRFILRNSIGESISDTTASTNAEGIATTTIVVDSVGSFTIVPIFEASSIYETTNLNANQDNLYNVRVINTWIIIWDNVLPISISLVSLIVLSMVTYRGIYVPKRNKRRLQMIEIHRQFADIENIQYMLIIHKQNGLSLFSQSFSNIPIDANLISGFLSAISSFGKEIGSNLKPEMNLESNSTPMDGNQGLEELSYQQFKIVVKDGEFIRTAVLLLKSPGESMKKSVQKFNQKLEDTHKEIFNNWIGEEIPREPIMKIVEEMLHVDLLYPHNLILSKVPGFLKSYGKKSVQSLIVKEAKVNFDCSFKVRDMIIALAAYGKKEITTFNSIHELRAEGVVFAVNPRTKALAEKFKPFIQQLSKEERLVLKTIEEGIKNQKDLENKTKILVVIPSILRLQQLELIDEHLNLTENGEIIVTLINMIPDL